MMRCKGLGTRFGCRSPGVAGWAGAVRSVSSSNDRARFGRGLALTHPVLFAAFGAALGERVRDLIPSCAYVGAFVHEGHVSSWACSQEASVGAPQRACQFAVVGGLTPTGGAPSSSSDLYRVEGVDVECDGSLPFHLSLDGPKQPGHLSGVVAVLPTLGYRQE